MADRTPGGIRIAALLTGIPSALFLLLSLAHPVLPGDLGSPAGDLLSLTCHRLPERGLQLPWGASGLCGRCTAFWAGMLAGSVAAAAASRPVLSLPLSLILLLPLVVDGVLQYAGLWESTLTLRLATGAACGLGVSSAVAGLAAASGSPGPPGPASGPDLVDK